MVQGLRRTAAAADGARHSARTLFHILLLSSTEWKQGGGQRKLCRLQGTGKDPSHLGVGNRIKPTLGVHVGPEPQLGKGQEH